MVLEGLFVQRTLRHKQHATLVVVNESVLQTAVPILRFAVTRSAARQAPLVLCTLERPAHVYSSATSIEVIDAVPSFASSSKAVDLTGPDGPLVLEQRLLDAIQRHNGQCDVVLDSVHPLADKGLDKVYSFTKRALSLLKPDALLVLSVFDTADQALNDLLLSGALSPSTVQLTLHPAVLLENLASTYGLTIDPPDPRLHQMLRSTRQRQQGDPFRRPRDADQDDERIRINDLDERGIVIEYLVRGPHLGKEKKVVYWGLETARSRPGTLELHTVPLTDVVHVKKITLNAPAEADTTDAPLTFNLSLTDSQRQAKDNVVLPYLPKTGATVDYEPDEADDFDDDDPDEDLEI